MRRIATTLYQALTARSQTLVAAELFTITLTNGLVLTYTDIGQDLVLTRAGLRVAYSGQDVIIGGSGKQDGKPSGPTWSCGLGGTADQASLSITYWPPESSQPSLVGAWSWPAAIRWGFFDDASYTHDIAFWTSAASLAAGQAPLGFGSPDQTGAISDGPVNLFTGRIGAIEAADGFMVKLQAKDDRVLLEENFPRNDYGADCKHVLFDAGCGLSAGSFATSATIGTGPTATTIPISGGGLTAGYYAQGRIVVAGALGIGAGALSALIGSNDTNNLYLVGPLPFAAVAGQSATLYPGCDKTRATCIAKFDNLIHRLAFDFVPPPATTI